MFLPGNVMTVLVNTQSIILQRKVRVRILNRICCVTSTVYARQKHLGCKKVRGQSEAILQTGRCDQKV